MSIRDDSKFARDAPLAGMSLEDVSSIPIEDRQKVEEEGMEQVDSRVRDRAKFLHSSVSKGTDENPESDKVIIFFNPCLKLSLSCFSFLAISTG